jgi:hypothetical protein
VRGSCDEFHRHAIRPAEAPANQPAEGNEPMRLSWKPMILCAAIVIPSLHSAPAEAMSECSRAKAYSSWTGFKADAICSVMGTGDATCQEAMSDAFEAELYEGWACAASDSEGAH